LIIENAVFHLACQNVPLLGAITFQVKLADYRECSFTFSLPKMLPLPGAITSQVNPADYRECSFFLLANCKNVAATRYHLEK
jgi:hypothetical protein